MIESRARSSEEVAPLAVPLWTEVSGVQAPFFTSLLEKAIVG